MTLCNQICLASHSKVSLECRNDICVQIEDLNGREIAIDECVKLPMVAVAMAR